jgi:hypothetical protein
MTRLCHSMKIHLFICISNGNNYTKEFFVDMWIRKCWLFEILYLRSFHIDVVDLYLLIFSFSDRTILLVVFLFQCFKCCISMKVMFGEYMFKNKEQNRQNLRNEYDSSDETAMTIYIFVHSTNIHHI